MDIEVRPCASREELRDVLNVIGHYFGHENAPEDVERFTHWIEVERIHAAFDGARVVGGAGAFGFRMSVPGGAASEGTIYGRFGYGLASRVGSFSLPHEWTAFAVPFEPRATVRLVGLEEAT